MNDSSTPLRPLQRDNNIRRRVIKAAYLQQDHSTKGKHTGTHVQPVRLIDNPNIFAQQLPQLSRVNQPIAKQLPPVALPSETIKSSEQYQRLLSEMERLASQHESEMKQLRQAKNELERELSSRTSNLYGLKMEMWQLKNGLMEYRGAMEEQQRYYSMFFQRLRMHELEQQYEQESAEQRQDQPSRNMSDEPPDGSQRTQ